MRNKMSLFVLLISLSSPLVAKEIWVVGQEQGLLRDSPSFLAEIAGALKYGTVLRPTKKHGKWYFLDFKKSKLKGWLHVSGFVKLEDVEREKENTTNVYDDEIAAAGKGFSSEYEKAYREQNPDISFNDVDELEKKKVSLDEIKKFIADGDLKSGKEL